MLISCSVVSIVIAVGSSYKGMIAAPQSIIISIIALMTASIVLHIDSPGDTDRILSTVLTAFMVTSILTGIFLFLLGYFRLGELIRFIPYPVIGGQIAGAGLLLVKGSIPVISGISLGFNNINLLLRADFILSLLPAVVFALILFYVNRHIKYFFIMPVLILSGIAAFYVFLLINNIPISEAKANGWLLPEIGSTLLWSPEFTLSFNNADWIALKGETRSILTIMFMSAVIYLIKASGIEMGTQKDIEFNHDLKVTGAANIIAGLAGGIIGFNSTTGTILAQKLGAHSRWAGLFHAFFCIVALFFGTFFISYLPKVIIGGITFFLGISFLVEWIYDSWFKLPKTDCLLILVILFVVATVGFLESVGVGIIIASIIFIINYSRLNVIKHEYSGKNQRSQVDRKLDHRRILETQGTNLYGLVLQGFLFFGSANNILARIKLRLSEKPYTKVNFVVLDFQNVSNIDTSAVNCFIKIKQLSKREKFILINTNMKKGLVKQLKHFGYYSDDNAECFTFPDLDRGLEWCEDKILEEHKAVDKVNIPITKQLRTIFKNNKMAAQFIKYLEKRSYYRGNFIFQQGDSANGLYLIESGEISIMYGDGKDKSVRIRSMRGSGLFGEMGLYSGETRFADAFAEKDSALYYLSRKSFKQIHIENPEIAIDFHQYIIRLLSERLRENNYDL